MLFLRGPISHDFSNLRIHTGAQASGLAHSLRARAYTVGQDVVFGQNRFQPDTSAGRHLLAHELAHTIHQGRGRGGYELVQRYDWVGADDFGMAEAAAEQAERRAEAARRHAAWGTSVDRQFGPELTNQARPIGAERERIDIALTGQRAAAFDAVAIGQGWLQRALEEQSYSGPIVMDVKQRWAEALVAVKLLKAANSASEVSTESRLEGLETIPAFYRDIGVLAPAIEQAHRTHVQLTNERLRTQYERQLAAHEEGQRMDRMAYGPRGEPGEGAFRAGLALARGSPLRSRVI